MYAWLFPKADCSFYLVLAKETTRKQEQLNKRKHDVWYSRADRSLPTYTKPTMIHNIKQVTGCVSVCVCPVVDPSRVYPVPTGTWESFSPTPRDPDLDERKRMDEKYEPQKTEQQMKPWEIHRKNKLSWRRFEDSDRSTDSGLLTRLS